MASILVIGGAGFIGSHVAKRLHQNGYRPVVFDSLLTGSVQSVRWGAFEYGDTRDTTRLAQVLRTYRPEAIVHLAALSSVAESALHPDKYMANNVGGVVSLCEAMRLASARCPVVFSSTAAVYGSGSYDQISESHPLAPISVYGETKRLAEQVLMDFSAHSGARVVALRYFNAAGSDFDAEIGESHNPETHIIPSLLLNIKRGENVAFINGADYSTPDGTCIRDYIHVVDLAEAHVLAIKASIRGLPSTIFNVGAGAGYSVKEVVNAISKVVKAEIRVVSRDRRLGDPPILVASTDRIERCLGFVPQHSELETIVGTAARWILGDNELTQSQDARAPMASNWREGATKLLSTAV